LIESRTSDSLEKQPGIETVQVVDVARDDHGTLAVRDEDNGRVDHVRCACAPAQHTRCLGEHLIERWNGSRRSLHEGAQRRLSRASSPYLAENARWNHKPRSVIEHRANERAHSCVTSLERDEGPRV
jgi:hypothetical protein